MYNRKSRIDTPLIVSRSPMTMLTHDMETCQSHHARSTLNYRAQEVNYTYMHVHACVHHVHIVTYKADCSPETCTSYFSVWFKKEFWKQALRNCTANTFKKIEHKLQGKVLPTFHQSCQICTNWAFVVSHFSIMDALSLLSTILLYNPPPPPTPPRLTLLFLSL